MFRIFVIFVVMAMVTADDQECLKSIQAKLIGYKTIFKNSLNVNQNKNEPQAEKEDNQEVESLIDDRANSVWADTLQTGIQTGSHLINQNNPLTMINSAMSNGGLQIIQQAMGQWVNQSIEVNEIMNHFGDTIAATGSQGIFGIGANNSSDRRSDSPSLKAMMTDISQTVNSLNGIIKVIDEIFNEK